MTVELKIGGRRYAGWKSVEVEESLDACAAQFGMSVTNRWASDPRGVDIPVGAEAVIAFDGVPLLTGYVEALEIAADSDGRTITVKGRDKTADAVDTSAPVKPGVFKNQTPFALAKLLCAPLGLAVTAAPDVQVDLSTPMPSCAVNPGETILDFLERHLSAFGVLLTSDAARGAVRLWRPGVAVSPVPLVEGENIKSFSATVNTSDRFATYTVLKQKPTRDAVAAVPAHAIEGTAEDSEIRPARSLIIVAAAGEAKAGFDTAMADDRAAWEKSQRIARGTRLSVTVQGWHDTPPTFWSLGSLVPVQIPSAGIAGSMMIANVKRKVGDGGTITDMDLVRCNTYTPKPRPIPGRGNANFVPVRDAAGNVVYYDPA